MNSESQPSALSDAVRATDPSSPRAVESRHAVARARVTMQPATIASVRSNTMKKGDVLSTARYAAIQGAKQTDSLVEEAKQVTVTDVDIRFEFGEASIDIEARVECVDRFGVAAQALCAVTIAALTIYDMCKSADRTMSIGALKLQESS